MWAIKYQISETFLGIGPQVWPQVLDAFRCVAWYGRGLHITLDARVLCSCNVHYELDLVPSKWNCLNSFTVVVTARRRCESSCFCAPYCVVRMVCSGRTYAIATHAHKDLHTECSFFFDWMNCVRTNQNVKNAKRTFTLLSDRTCSFPFTCSTLSFNLVDQTRYQPESMQNRTLAPRLNLLHSIPSMKDLSCWGLFVYCVSAPVEPVVKFTYFESELEVFNETMAHLGHDTANILFKI